MVLGFMPWIQPFVANVVSVVHMLLQVHNLQIDMIQVKNT